MVSQGCICSLPAGEWPQHGLEEVRLCPVCRSAERHALHEGLTDRVFFCAPGRWTLYQCHQCHSAYLDPRPTSASIGLAYQVYYTHGDTPAVPQTPASLRRRFRLALRNGYLNAHFGYRLSPALALGRHWFGTAKRLETDRWIRHLHLPCRKPRLLDLGCGNGAFLVQMQEAGWQVFGLDIDPKAVAACQKAGLSVQLGWLDEGRFPDGFFDAITLSHVIEHLHHPEQILRVCYRILRPQGVLWIATPNLASLGHQQFGPDWFALDPPRHLLLFTAASLKRLLSESGFGEIIQPRPTRDSKWLFRASAAVARGNDPFNAPGLSFWEKWQYKRQARRAERRADGQPELAEELVLVSRKPGSIVH